MLRCTKHQVLDMPVLINLARYVIGEAFLLLGTFIIGELLPGHAVRLPGAHARAPRFFEHRCVLAKLISPLARVQISHSLRSPSRPHTIGGPARN